MKREITLLFFLTAAAFLLNACSDAPKSNSNNQLSTAKSNIQFTDATQASGVNFKHIPTRTENKWLPEIMGSGVGVADFNRDGAPDIVLIGGGAVGANRSAEAKNRLYINDGKGKFTDKTDEWKLESRGYGMGLAVGDFDGDGWTDLFLTSYEGDNRLLKNTGAGFEDVTENSGIKSDGGWATSAGFFDFDADGDLDLFIVRYVDFTTANAQKTFRNRMLVYPTPILYKAVADQLWRNEGGGKFTDASAQAGINSAPGKGLALALGDIDSDGDTDVYVANDTDSNYLWINDGKGKFKNIAQLSGAAYSEIGREQGNMGADFSDVDGNLLQDIAVTTFQDEATAVYSQTAPLLFSDVSDAIGIGQTSRARLKFGLDFFDADNDGDEDLLVANGHIEDNIDQNSDSVSFAQINSLYENLGNGKFTNISASAGNALGDKQVSRGLATADFDADGDLDFIVSNNGGTAQIAFNETTQKGNFVALWLEGERANRNAIGTRVVARIGDKKIERQIMGAQSYLSISDFRVHFGLGAAQKIDELTIYWLGGEAQIIRDLQSGKFYYVRQGKEPQPFVAGEKKID
jgi:hypothetical protein